jgi:hypothetical protein
VGREANLALVTVLSVSIQSHVAAFSPTQAPAVAADPVVEVIVADESHEEHRVVDIGLDHGIAPVEDARVVEHELEVCIHRHRHWPLFYYVC